MALLIAFPPAYHWWASVVPFVELPAAAFTVFPTATEPEIVGVTAARVPAATATVCGDVNATDDVVQGILEF